MDTRGESTIMTLSEFFYMDGYYFYVWASYALAFIVMLALFINPLRRKKQLLKSLGRKKRRGQRL
jgi:heme exporter protein D